MRLQIVILRKNNSMCYLISNFLDYDKVRKGLNSLCSVVVLLKESKFQISSLGRLGIYMLSVDMDIHIF